MISLFAGMVSWTALALPPADVGSLRGFDYAVPLAEVPSAGPGLARGGLIGAVSVAPNAEIGVGIFKPRARDQDFPGSDVLGRRKARKRSAGIAFRFSF